MKITPVLFVEAIEPSLQFWVDRLGFEKAVEVPEGDRLGFVILQKGDAELMYQTRASLQKDQPDFAPGDPRKPAVTLFIEVEDFNDTVRRLGNAEVVAPTRDTFYGMREIVVREPGGHAVVFAAKIK